MKLTFLVTSTQICGRFVKNKNNLLLCQSVPNDVKNYFNFCTIFGLKQLDERPTRLTCSISSIMNGILPCFPNRVTQQGILNVGLPNHQLVYPTRNIFRIKIVDHNKSSSVLSKNIPLMIMKKLWLKLIFLDTKPLIK